MNISPQTSPTKAIGGMELSPTKGYIQHALFSLAGAAKKSISGNAQALFQEIAEHQEKLAFLTSAKHTRMISREIQKEQREIFTKIRSIVSQLLHAPKSTGCDTNGSYFLFVDDTTIAGVYKPRLQARGCIDNPQGAQLRRGIPLGQECMREKLADILNVTISDRLVTFVPGLFDFSVPLTEIDDYKHDTFGDNHSVGSFQTFVPKCKSLDSMSDQELKKIPANELIKAALFDLMTLNNDRHLGNLLYNDSSNKVFLIDHGACFPERKGVEDVSFDWMHLPFANEPVSKPFREYILSLSPKAIVHTLAHASKALDQVYPKQDMLISSDALFVHLHALVLLQEALRVKPDLSIAEFARGYCKESLPVVEVVYDNTVLQVPLDPKTDLKNFDTKAFCAVRNINYDQASIVVRRKTIGGHFLPLINQNFQAMKSPSMETLLAKTETLHRAIKDSIKPTLFLNLQEMCQK